MIYLDASDVAAASGQHRFKQLEAVLAKVYRKTRATAAASLDDAALGSLAAVAVAAVVTSAQGVRAAIAEERPEKRARLVAQAVEEAAAGAASNLTAAEEAPMLAARVAAEMLSAVQTARGVRDEAAGIAAVPGCVPGDGRIRYRVLRTPSRLQFKVGARIDGRCSATGQMLEVKTRQRGLFSTIPKYELIQVLTYLFVFDEQTCLFRQRYPGERAEGASSTAALAPDELVKRDDEELLRLVGAGLDTFAAKLVRLDEDESYRREVLVQHPRRAGAAGGLAAPQWDGV